MTKPKSPANLRLDRDMAIDLIVNRLTAHLKGESSWLNVHPGDELSRGRILGYQDAIRIADELRTEGVIPNPNFDDSIRRY
jgi:hypothetical protein